jgi:hypothetical protein
MEDYSMIVDA